MRGKHLGLERVDGRPATPGLTLEQEELNLDGRDAERRKLGNDRGIERGKGDLSAGGEEGEGDLWGREKEGQS